MAEQGPNTESTQPTGIFNSIKTIFSILKNAFTPATPLEEIPPATILAGAKIKEGLSAIEIASNIIRRKNELGVGIGPLPSGAQNLDLIMETIRCEEIVKALLTKAKIEVSVPPGVKVTTSGGNAGGPVVGQGATIEIGFGEGIIR